MTPRDSTVETNRASYRCVGFTEDSNRKGRGASARKPRKWVRTSVPGRTATRATRIPPTSPRIIHGPPAANTYPLRLGGVATTASILNG